MNEQQGNSEKGIYQDLGMIASELEDINANISEAESILRRLGSPQPKEKKAEERLSTNPGNVTGEALAQKLIILSNRSREIRVRINEFVKDFDSLI